MYLHKDNDRLLSALLDVLITENTMQRSYLLEHGLDLHDCCLSQIWKQRGKYWCRL